MADNDGWRRDGAEGQGSSGYGRQDEPTDPPTQKFPPVGGAAGGYEATQQFGSQRRWQYPAGGQEQRPQWEVPAGDGSGGYGSEYPEPSSGGNSNKPMVIALIVLVVVLILALAGVVSYLVFNSSTSSDEENQAAVGSSATSVVRRTAEASSPVETSSASAPTTTQTTTPATTTASSTAPTTSAQSTTQQPSTTTPARVGDVPSYATEVISGYPAGSYQNTYKSGPTSNAFALEVRDSYVSQYAATGAKNQELQVTSPTTGQTYIMRCENKSDAYVQCSGGDNANVYLY